MGRSLGEAARSVARLKDTVDLGPKDSLNVELHGRKTDQDRVVSSVAGGWDLERNRKS